MSLSRELVFHPERFDAAMFAVIKGTHGETAVDRREHVRSQFREFVARPLFRAGYDKERLNTLRSRALYMFHHVEANPAKTLPEILALMADCPHANILQT
jgi:hypothetical protein